MSEDLQKVVVAAVTALISWGIGELTSSSSDTAVQPVQTVDTSIVIYYPTERLYLDYFQDLDTVTANGTRIIVDFQPDSLLVESMPKPDTITIQTQRIGN